MNSKVIYTCITGRYDQLLQPEIIDRDFDYICFSNDIPVKQIGIWQIRKISFENSDNSRVSRYPKILPHKVLKEYEYSVYMDANIQIIGKDFYSIVKNKIEEGVLIAQVPHLERDCVYEDIRTAYYYNKVDFFSAYKQFKHLRTEGYPKHNGLYENNVILRNHNEQNVIDISENWWKEYSSYSRRDQFSLVFIYWKKKFKPCLLFGETLNARNVSHLKMCDVHPDNSPLIIKALKRIISYIMKNFFI